MSKILQIWSLSKTFPGQVALHEVTFDVEEGEVHALVGQNGSGKSTLIKVLAGFHQPDPGHHVTMRDEAFAIGNAQAAQAAGIRFVHQDLGLVEAVSAVENLAIGFGYRTGFGRRIKWREETKRAKQALLDLGFDINVRVPVAALGGAARTGVAIARALQDAEQNISILILDEPTASLPGADVDRLFEAVRRLKARGISVVFVSHHLEEVFEIADRVTVLRDAKVVATKNTSELDMVSLIELIVGHKVTAASTDRQIDQSAAPRLEVRGLTGMGLSDVSFEVRPGEVLGVAGLTGSGRDTLIPSLSGAIDRLGDVLVDGAPLKAGDPSTSIASGLAFVPADRLRNGIISLMSVRSNTTLADVKRNKTGLRLNHKKEKAETIDWIRNLSVVTTGSEAPISTLSGGNQQKVMMSRSFRLNPKVLLLDEPTQGVDIGAKEEIHTLVDSAASSGSAVLVASTDSAELARLCDRVIVMHKGVIVDTVLRNGGSGVSSMAERIDQVLLAGSILVAHK
ncbi:MAG: sugar ABC transporter ATP-binding protein [Ilumatobacteraceae bacterium]